MRRVFLSFLGAGWLKPAPGTWGSLAALPAALVLHIIGGPALLIIATLVIFFLGTRAVAAEINGAEDHDPGWIVIDEVVGQWIALMPVAIGAAYFARSPLDLWPGILAGFALFRLFDIWKPWLAGRADRRGDALGLMLDDVWAGIFAAVVVVLLATLSHAGVILSGVATP